ncbi:MAG TPA: hypothetical protein DDW90_00750 [Cyanobacteria bacterium UBA9971]|nr:hypothetical protein [Cyanobacteria bacterium UBA9971]
MLRNSYKIFHIQNIEKVNIKKIFDTSKRFKTYINQLLTTIFRFLKRKFIYFPGFYICTKTPQRRLHKNRKGKSFFNKERKGKTQERKTLFFYA